MIAPFPLVTVDAAIASSYDAHGHVSGPRANLVPLAKLGKAGICAADVAPALLALHTAILSAGGDPRFTELHRDLATQAKARAKYECWDAAGRPKPGSAGFNAATMKAAYVATPGRSGHNAGRSTDNDLASLHFPGVAADKQLDRLWELAIPIGWTPVIKEAKEGAAESWHFDFMGELHGVYTRLGYEQWALCGALLVGHGDMQGFDAVIQALLCRAGYAIGKIDGVIGAQTVAALRAALPGVDVAAALKSKDESIFSPLAALLAA